MIDLSKISSNLSLAADGVWYGAEQREVSYPSEGNQACFQIEDSSFWFNHRNECIVSAVRALPPAKHGAIFDIGGGNGFVSLGLIRAGFDAVLVEPGHLGAANAKKRGISTVVCATAETAGFSSASLDAVGLFDVIEHIDDDGQFLQSIRRLLKPGGRLYATVPAYSVLWSKEDELAGHFRRYTCKSIADSIGRAGFKLDYATYIFRPLPLPILLLRAIPHRLGYTGTVDNTRQAANDHRPAGGVASRALAWMLDRELGNIASRRSMAFGGSCMVVATAN